MNLTAAQQQVVNYGGRNLQLIACAGSGKTEVVAQRIAHLLTNAEDEKLEPCNIVAFTFTEKAAAELKERIVLRTREAAGSNMTGMAEMYVGTIHGFCQELLQNEVPDYRKYEVLDSVRQALWVNRNSAQSGLTTTKKLSGQNLVRWKDTSLYLAALSVLREASLNPGFLDGTSVMEGLEKYDSQLSQGSLLDFSAMLEKAVFQLETNSHLRGIVSERIKYVVVDEYQDVNPIQERLIRILHDLGSGVCVVGDDDQTIYQWRGSQIDSILTFAERYPEVEQIRLEENFRSSEGIIDAAKGFIQKVEPRLDKAMKFAEAQVYEEGDVVALHFESPAEEANYVAETIRSLRGVAFDEGDGERGLSWSDMAILLRSVRNHGTAITDALREVGVPFVVKGLANLFDTEECCAARSLFHFVANESIRSYRNFSVEDIESPTLASLKLAWDSADVGLTADSLNHALDYLKQLTERLHSGEEGSQPTIQSVFLEFLSIAELREERMPEGRGQIVLFNLGQFSKVIEDWESINFRSNPVDSFRGFASFLYNQAEDEYSEGAEDNDYLVPDAVQVMTVHQAKGREWPAVFVPALVKDHFPPRPKNNNLWEVIPSEGIEGAARYDGSLDDERRLFYVAMTRSKKFLHMTYGPRAKGGWYRYKSEFWDDILFSKFVKRSRQDYADRKRLEASARTSVSDVTFSFSDLKYLFECGYQFKLKVLYGFNGPIEPAMGLGKSMHDALAEVHQRSMRGETVSTDDVEDLVERHFRAPYAFGVLNDRLRELAKEGVTRYIIDNEEKLRQVEFSEQAIEIHMGDGVSVNGRIDLVRRTDTGEITIVDLKSNERSQRESVTEAQLDTYALGYRELTGSDADYLEIYDLEEGRGSIRSVDHALVEGIRGMTHEAASALRTLNLVPAPLLDKCRRCDFRMLCSESKA